MAVTPWRSSAALIRLASRLSKPGQPVSTRIDSPAGVTIRVAAPPSDVDPLDGELAIGGTRRRDERRGEGRGQGGALKETGAHAPVSLKRS